MTSRYSMVGFLVASILTLSAVGVTLLLQFHFVAAEDVSKKAPTKILSPVILDNTMKRNMKSDFIRPRRRRRKRLVVPGDGGSQLEAKLDKPSKVHIFCDQKTDRYFNLWLNPNLLFPGIVDCWVDNMRLLYNHSSRTTRNSPGVDIRVPGFGNTTSVEWLDPSGKIPSYIARFILSAYFVDISDMLVKEGYTRGVNIRGAPYDYRKAPNEFKEYYKSLKHLVEETYEMNSQTKVTFICHSMGCPITSYFMGQQWKSWKKKYIKGLVSLGGAWGGAIKAMKVIASGENLGIMIVSQTKLRTEQRSPSLAYMLPSPLVWNKKDRLAWTNEKNYTVENYEEFFKDINFTTGYEMYKDTYRFAEKGLKPPGVEVHCLHGQGLDTPEGLDFRKKGSLPNTPKLKNGDGDGTVNFKSLESCKRWIGKQAQKVTYFSIPKLEHMKILAHKPVLEYIKYFVMTW